MNFCFFVSVLDKFCFFFRIVILSKHMVKIMGFPIFLSSIKSLHLSINLQLFIMQLEIPVCNDIIISQPRCRHFLFLLLFLSRGRGPLIRGQIMMVLKRFVRYNVILSKGSRCTLLLNNSGFFLRVAWLVLQALQLVLKVDYVIYLLIS